MPRKSVITRDAPAACGGSVGFRVGIYVSGYLAACLLHEGWDLERESTLMGGSATIRDIAVRNNGEA